jgi:hypothetical protein
MILSILLVLLLAGSALVVVVLVSPLGVKFTFDISGLRVAGGGVFSFLHPALVTVAFNFSDRSYVLKILGRQFGKKKDTSEAPSPEPAAAATPADDTPAPEPPKAAVETPSPTDSPGSDNPASAPVFEHEEEDLSNGTQDPPQPENAAPVEATARAEDAAAVRSPAPETPPLPHVPPPKAAVPSVNETAPESEGKEKVASATQKRDNWFKRLERNRYLFFIRNARWRTKMFGWLFRVIRTFFRIVRFDRCDVAVRAGVSDPVITGTLTGLYQAARYGLPMKHPPAFSFEPVFMRNHFEGKGSIQVATSLAHLLLPLAVAVVTFPVLPTLWLVWLVYRRERRYKKETAE